MTDFKRNEIILLLGAGASIEAGIPDSNEMVKEIEKLVSGKNFNWNRFKHLYRYIRSSIFFADGLEGRFGNDVPYNIERLVNVLDELQKKERHVLYPFVGAWNPKLLDVAGTEFENVRKFRTAIIQILRNQWVALREEETASYYKGLLRFQREYGHPLRVFSLNYDLCVEKICSYEAVQRGFFDRKWDWQLLDETLEDQFPLLLYKLHGSTDWAFTEDGKVTYYDAPNCIPDEETAIIFGDSYKLQYIDPFLFLAYQLRRRSLEARLIVCVGYGFNDEHINGILKQSLLHNPERKLLAIVGPAKDSTSSERTEKNVSKKLAVRKGQIIEEPKGAKEFFESGLTISSLANHCPPEDDLIPALPESIDATN